MRFPPHMYIYIYKYIVACRDLNRLRFYRAYIENSVMLCERFVVFKFQLYSKNRIKVNAMIDTYLLGAPSY